MAGPPKNIFSESRADRGSGSFSDQKRSTCGYNDRPSRGDANHILTELPMISLPAELISMHCVSQRRFPKGVLSLFLCIAALWLACGNSVFAQLPYINAGPDSAFAQIDFAQIYLDGMNKRAQKSNEQKARDKELIDSGVLSALDLAAPNNALEHYNRANSMLRAQNSKEAIQHLRKAISEYPKFVSAHIGLGLAYLDQDDTATARKEFEVAAKLDEKFPGSFMNLGLLALSTKDFTAAQEQFTKAVTLRPSARALSALAYAQNGAHEYPKALETATRVHGMEHKGMANVHYVAASAAMSLNDFDSMERELQFFLNEDPTNAFAPLARRNLTALTQNKIVRAPGNAPQQNSTLATAQVFQTFPNSDRLKAQLSALGDESESGTCDDCNVLADASLATDGSTTDGSLPGVSFGGSAWTIRKSVDEVSLFLAVSNHGHMVNDLALSDIKIRDDNKPPDRVLQFTPQSKLPLRLALLVDTSGSVEDRFSFEKRAATKFIEKILNPDSDLGFISGFANETTVTQDFSADTTQLGKGIEKLTNGGGTALFDAISSACWKLAKYPDHERVGRVLVILSDGEDNSSHNSLKQAIQVSERTGVTIYAISTRENLLDKADADKILEALAVDSGGQALFPGDMATLSQSFDKLREGIRGRYFIAYAPADFEPNGSYRTIKVVAEKDGKRLQVRSRKGYHARLEAVHN
jgi:VWFA-related protein